MNPKVEKKTVLFDELPLYLEVSDSTFDIHTVSISYRAVKISDVFEDGLAIVDDSGRRVLVCRTAIVAVEINEVAKKQKIKGDM